MIEQFVINFFITILLVIGIIATGCVTFLFLALIEETSEIKFIKNHKGKISVLVSILCVLINIIILFL